VVCTQSFEGSPASIRPFPTLFFPGPVEGPVKLFTCWPGMDGTRPHFVHTSPPGAAGGLFFYGPLLSPLFSYGPYGSTVFFFPSAPLDVCMALPFKVRTARPGDWFPFPFSPPPPTLVSPFVFLPLVRLVTIQEAGFRMRYCISPRVFFLLLFSPTPFGGGRYDHPPWRSAVWTLSSTFPFSAFPSCNCFLLHVSGSPVAVLQHGCRFPLASFFSPLCIFCRRTPDGANFSGSNARP